MNDTIVKTLTAAEYFLTRKKHMERYIEGEHAWYGAVDSTTEFTYANDPRPWYLHNSVVLKQQSFQNPAGV